eukprot:4486379-Prorocentrum_lima.AAC.1
MPQGNEDDACNEALTAMERIGSQKVGAQKILVARRVRAALALRPRAPPTPLLGDVLVIRARVFIAEEVHAMVFEHKTN